MRILVINQHFHPEVASSAQIITELCEDLVKRGHQVTVVTGNPSYRRVEDVDQSAKSDESGREKAPRPPRDVIFNFLLKRGPRKLISWSNEFGINIIRVYNYVPWRLRQGPLRYVQRMIQYITFFFSSLLVTMMLKRKDVVLYLSTPPLLNGITVALIKALKGTPNVYNIQDLYPDIAVKLGVIKPGLLVDFCKFLEKYSYSQADGIVPIGMLMAQCVEEKGIPKSKITVIPNWTDTQKLRPLGKDTPFAREHNLTDKFIAMYSGNIGLSQGLENVIKAAQITADLPDLVYLFIGGGANLGALKKSADDLKLSNVRFLPYQPKNRLSESLSAADIHLLTLKKGLSNFSVPSKIYGIMASGRPLIASVDEDSEIKLMVGESQCGVCVPPEDPEAIAKAIRTLYHDRDKLNEMGENGRRYLENHITRTICVQAYEKLFEKIRDEYAA